MYVTTTHAGDFISFVHGNSSSAKFRQEAVVVGAPQCGVRLLRGTKIIFNAEMDLHAATFEPTSAANDEFSRLRNLSHAQNAGVEGAGRFFLSGGHGQLHVINGDECRGSRAQVSFLRRKNRINPSSRLWRSEASVRLDEDTSPPCRNDRPNLRPIPEMPTRVSAACHRTT